MKLNSSFKNIINLFLFLSIVFSNDPLAVITKSSGKVDYKKFDSDKIRNPNMGMSIFNDDLFQTSEILFVALEDHSPTA